MKILQTIPYMLASQGGPSTCTHDLMVGLNDIGADVDLLTSKPAAVRGEVVLGEGEAWMKAVECDYKTPLALSKNVDEFLSKTTYDLYHANTLWLYATHATCRYARRVGKPYVLSTHGMLYPTALKVSGWKKRLMSAVWFRRDVMKAACIHATCHEEARHVRAYGYTGPIAVIPNPVVIPDAVRTETAGKNLKNGRKEIGFLGRLHPIKKVEQVLYAMTLLKDSERARLTFTIIGKFDEHYEAWLKKEVTRLGLEDCVAFAGFVSGDDKYQRLQGLWALMVPSEQENFGMIVPEALISCTPVYASLGTPWEELQKERCGWWTDNSAEAIVGVLRHIIEADAASMAEMGQRGRRLIENKYEQHRVAAMMLQLYEWLNGETEKPDFVYEEDESC